MYHVRYMSAPSASSGSSGTALRKRLRTQRGLKATVKWNSALADSALEDWTLVAPPPVRSPSRVVGLACGYCPRHRHARQRAVRERVICKNHTRGAPGPCAPVLSSHALLSVFHSLSLFYPYVAGFTAIVGKRREHLTVAAFRLTPPPHWHYCSPGRCTCRV